MPICARCRLGFDTADGVAVCPRCGAAWTPPPPAAGSAPRRFPVVAITVGILVLLASTAGAWWWVSEPSATPAGGSFPELQPDLAAPAGYKWEFRDGPDFYTWVLVEPAEAGKRVRS